MDRCSVDQKKSRRKNLVISYVRVACFLRLFDRPLQEINGWWRPLAFRVPLVIFVVLQVSLDLCPNYSKPRLFVSSVGPGKQGCHEAA